MCVLAKQADACLSTHTQWMGRGAGCDTDQAVVSRSDVERPTEYVWWDGNLTKRFSEGAELPEFTQMLVRFPRALTAEEQEVACGIVCYWAKLPYVSNGTTANHWVTPSQFWIDANIYRTRSTDWRERGIFENLNRFLREGTPVRKDGTQRWFGLDVIADQIVLNHDGDRPIAEPRRRTPREQVRRRGGMLYSR
jgi:hypothetical protein